MSSSNLRVLRSGVSTSNHVRLAISRQAYRDALLENALDKASLIPGTEASIFRARTLQRLGRLDESSRELRWVGKLDADAPLSTVASAHAALAWNELNLGNLDRCRDAAEKARAPSFKCSDVIIEAEYHYLEGALAYCDGDMDEASQAVEDILSLTRQYNVPRFKLMQDSIFGVLAHSLDARISALNGKHTRQAQSYAQAIDAVKHLNKRNRWFEGYVFRDFAFYVRDLGSSDDRVRLATQLEASSDWPAELNGARADMQSAMGWALEREGDFASALKFLRLAAETATNNAWHILAILDRAAIAKSIGEVIVARDEVERAYNASLAVNWSGLGEESIVLAQLASQLSDFSLNHACDMFARFRQASANKAFFGGSKADPRPFGYSLLFDGKVNKAAGNLERALASFSEAFEIFDKLDYGWRRASAALELAELTGFQHFGECARKKAAEFPKSSFAKRCRDLSI